MNSQLAAFASKQAGMLQKPYQLPGALSEREKAPTM